MSRTCIDSAVGLKVNKIHIVTSASGCGIDLMLDYSAMLQIRAGGLENTKLAATLEGEPIFGIVGEEITFVHYDDDMCSPVMYLSFDNGKEMTIRAIGEGSGVSWIEASLH